LHIWKITAFLLNAVKNQGARAIDTDGRAKMKYTNESSYENEIIWLLQLTGRQAL